MWPAENFIQRAKRVYTLPYLDMPCFKYKMDMGSPGVGTLRNMH